VEAAEEGWRDTSYVGEALKVGDVGEGGKLSACEGELGVCGDEVPDEGESAVGGEDVRRGGDGVTGGGEGVVRVERLFIVFARCLPSVHASPNRVQ
jgi:hypothetical protein